VEPAVLTVIDDLAVLQAGQAFDGLSDVERVEILRGPQGTLFGKGASSGVVSIITRGPTETFDAYVNSQLISGGRLHVEGAAGGPLSETMGVRLSGYYKDSEGYVLNRATGTKLGGNEGFGARAKLRWTPADVLQFDVAGTHQEQEGTTAPWTYRILPPGTRAVNVRAEDYLNGVMPGPRNREVNRDLDGFFRTNTNTVSLKAALDLDAVSLISITGYQDWRYNSVQDFDNTTAPIFGFPPFNAKRGVVQESDYGATLFSQELRLVSQQDGPLNYLAGLYYANGETDRRFIRALDTPLGSDWDSTAGTETKAVFGEVSYMLPTQTEISAGLRYNHETIDVSFTNFRLTGAPPANNATCLETCVGEFSDDVVTYKLAVRQELTPDLSVYASYATGYKGGAFDVTSGFSPRRAQNPARPEEVTSYELGLRGSIGSTVQVGLTGFWSDYKDFQRQAVIVPPNPADPIEFRLANVGALRTKGIEFEFRSQPVRNLQLNGFVSYLDATIRAFPDADCYAGQTAAEGCRDPDGAGPIAGTQDLAGARLNGAPKWRYNLFTRYDFDIPDAPFDPFIQADYTYQSNVQTDLLQDPRGVIDGYGLLDATAGVDLKNSDTTIAVFVNNLLDNYYDAGSGAAPFHPDTARTNVVTRDQERTFGIRLTSRF
jgi:iron complex outermembrane receptor protein